MTQEFYFYKQKIFAEEISQKFSHEHVSSAIKALLKNSNLEEDEQLRNELFEEVEINSLSISAYDNKVEKLLTKNLFISPHSRLFMVSQKIWSTIEKLIEDRQKELKATTDQTNEFSQLSKDCSTLKELFDKKLLFINIQ